MEPSEEKLPQGQRVSINIGTNHAICLEGMICGVAQNYLPVIGFTYIVELDGSGIDGYEYTHVVANTTQIELIIE